MLNPSLLDPDLRKAVLKPLLDDFQFWFRRTRELLEQEQLAFLEAGEQSDLLARVRKNQQQVTVAQSLLEATEDEAGIEITVLMSWHQLVLDCWQVTLRLRRKQSELERDNAAALGSQALESDRRSHPPATDQAA